MLIQPFHTLYRVIFDTEQDEYKSNFIFLIGAGINFILILFCCLFGFYATRVI